MAESIQVSVPLPHSIDTRIYIHLTARSKYVMLFLTTASAEEVGTPTPMGSFVYALPDVSPLHRTITTDAPANPSSQRFNPNQPISTTLFTVEPTIEFTTRLAKLLVRKTGLPAYVSNSLSLASTGLGGTVEEEMDAFKKVVETLAPLLDDLVKSGGAVPNGTGSSGS
jgi:hypothetical protein